MYNFTISGNTVSEILKCFNSIIGRVDPDTGAKIREIYAKAMVEGAPTAFVERFRGKTLGDILGSRSIARDDSSSPHKGDSIASKYILVDDRIDRGTRANKRQDDRELPTAFDSTDVESQIISYLELPAFVVGVERNIAFVIMTDGNVRPQHAMCLQRARPKVNGDLPPGVDADLYVEIDKKATRCDGIKAKIDGHQLTLIFDGETAGALGVTSELVVVTNVRSNCIGLIKAIMKEELLIDVM